MAISTKGRAAAIRDSANVVRLPGAATRRPDNNRFAEQRRASAQLRRETAKRFGYKHHHNREAERAAETYMATDTTPALMIVAAMFRHMEPEAQDKVMAAVASMANRGRKAHDQAMLAMRLSRPMPFGEAHDFARALTAIANRDVRLVQIGEVL